MLTVCARAAEKNAGDAAEDAATDARERPVMITHTESRTQMQTCTEMYTSHFISYTLFCQLSDNGTVK